MTKGTMAFVVGDAGAANEMIPVAPVLIKRGWEVPWFADKDGKAAANFAKKGTTFETRGPTSKDAPRVVCVGTSSKAAALGNTWTTWGQDPEHRIPVAWYSDLPGTDNRQRMAAFNPNFNLVTSAIHAEISRERRPLVPLYIVGKPTCVEDRGRAEVRINLREELKVGRGMPSPCVLITYLSGGESEIRAKEQLYAIADTVKELGQGGKHIFLEARLNPVLKEEARKEMMEVLRAKLGSQVYPGTLTTLEAVFAADVVVGDWGCTDTTRSAACGIPTALFTNFPEDSERLEEAFGTSQRHPLLRTEAAHEIASKGACGEVLATIMGDYDLAARQTWKNAKPFRDLQEPGAAERIADVLEEIAEKHQAA